MNTGTYGTAEARKILAAAYDKAYDENGDDQKAAFEAVVKQFNLRSFDPTLAALLHLAEAPTDLIEPSDWPEGYPIGDMEHARLTGSAGLNADVSIPKPVPIAA